MSYPNKIILIGLMGAGKTTVGKMLASIVGCNKRSALHQLNTVWEKLAATKP